MEKHRKKLKEIGMESEFLDWLKKDKKKPFYSLQKGDKFMVKDGPYVGKIGVVEGEGIWGKEEEAFVTMISSNKIYLRKKDYHMIELL